MFTRLLLSAIITGLIAGLVLTIVQRFEVIPIILEAERHEQMNVSSTEHTHSDGEIHEHWSPDDGFERLLWTALANVSLGIGFALLLCGAYVWRGSARSPAALGVSLREGLLWGIAGLTVFFVNPSIGIPPEIPGAATGAHEWRQGWWLLTVGCTAVGLFCIAFYRRTFIVFPGALLCLLPHFIGAPESPPLSADLLLLKQTFLSCYLRGKCCFLDRFGGDFCLGFPAFCCPSLTTRLTESQCSTWEKKHLPSCLPEIPLINSVD